MLKDILVHVDGSGSCGARVAFAAVLAQKHDAHLTGLLPLERVELPGYVAAQIGADALAEAGAIRLAAAAAVKAGFDDAVAAAGVRGEWRQEVGEAAALLAQHARYADLLVVSQPEADDKAGEAWLPGELALASGRPVLILPRASAGRPIARRALVAWNASREAARAVHDALPLLAGAEAVIVVEVDPDDTGHIPGADIAAHLARHGLAVEARHCVAPDIAVGDELLNVASDTGSDLIVMGAYGRSRLREAIFGGATRHILRHMTVPVLMSH